MKAAVFHGKGDIRVEDLAMRAPGTGEVAVRVEACGICGTDVHIFQGAEGAAQTTPPVILGHEFSGVVHEVGSGVKSVKAGDRVCVDPNDMCGACYFCRDGKAHFCENMIGIGTTVDGGFAEYCTLREKQVYKIPDSLSFDEGAMAEPVACCLHGMDLTGVTPGQTVMVIGGGTIGLIMLQLSKLSGASTLILVEPVQSKRELGLRLGADIAVDPSTQSIDDVLKAYSIKTVDAAIECVGSPNTMQDAIRHAGRGGTVMMFGLTHPDSEIPLKPFDVFRREITIKASFINPYTQKRAVSLLGSRRIDVGCLITDAIGLGDLQGVLETGAYKSRGKMIVRPR